MLHVGWMHDVETGERIFGAFVQVRYDRSEIVLHLSFDTGLMDDRMWRYKEENSPGAIIDVYGRPG